MNPEERSHVSCASDRHHCLDADLDAKNSAVPWVAGPLPTTDSPAGNWHFTTWPTYFGISTRSGWHFRLGVRYADIDGYYTWPSPMIKQLNPDNSSPVTARLSTFNPVFR
jgi:hypothetical protein